MVLTRHAKSVAWATQRRDNELVSHESNSRPRRYQSASKSAEPDQSMATGQRGVSNPVVLEVRVTPFDNQRCLWAGGI